MSAFMKYSNLKRRFKTRGVFPNLLTFVVILSCRIAVTKAQACVPTDCITSQWTEWTECTQSCGSSGVQARTRKILAPESCGGQCSGGVFESQPCNVRCCAENCAFTEWTAWGYCSCTSNACPDPSPWTRCVRYRDKIKNATCGGYCDNVIFQQQCKKPCCYKDCIMGSWGPWEACDARCESDGFRIRNRTVIQEPDCGGNRCEYESETTTCKGPCCPQNCVIGQWSDWSACSASCGVGNVTRTRFFKYPVCGGANCTETEDTQSQLCENYVNIDCVMGPWSDWTDCKLNNSFCGEGTKKRQRSIVTNSQCYGQPCPAAEETALCYGPCCVTDCKVGNWTDFGFCSTQCGEGRKNRTRPILVQQSCGGSPCPDVVEFTSCSVQNATNCSFTQWSVWSACSTDCGQGKNIRTRTLLTPSYCGGQCQGMQTEEQRDCNSTAAKRDCQVSAWGSWGPCIRDCEKGMQRSTRNITVVEACGGLPCAGRLNLTQIRTCHEKCSQLCNQGKCSCNPGYVLNATDGYSCNRRSCGAAPKISYCPPGTVAIESCRSVQMYCGGSILLFGDRCNTSCSQPGWIVKGEPKFSECQADGTWTYPNIFCGPPNKAPLNININSTNVSELLKVNQCFAKLTTTTDNEVWDKHTYSVIADPSNSLKAVNDALCLKQAVDYETVVYKIWNATIRSTDLDGLFVDVNFTFSIINENDPPKSAKLVPSTLQENSPKGTEIGCFQVADDDPGQNITVSLLTNANLFELFKSNSTFCLRVLIESNVNCTRFGGKLCAFNYEVKNQYFIAIGVRDDGVPPAVTYFNIEISVMDVNEPITDVTVSPDSAAENITPGQTLLRLVAADEDKVRQHKFELLTDPYGIFVLNNENLSSTVPLDFEAVQSNKYVIRVRGTDLTTPVSSVEVNVTFGVKDINEPPYMLQLTSANSLSSYPPNKPIVKENIPAVVIGTLSALDPDKGDNITFTVSSDKFRVTSPKCTVMTGNNTNYCSGKLVNLAGLNYEDTPFILLNITAQDSLRLIAQLLVNITVINMDDQPKDILVDGNVADSIFVPENSKNSRVAELATVDEDVDDLYNYFLSGPMASQFRIDGNILSTTPSSSLDYESYIPSKLIITTVSTSRSGLSAVKTFNIVLTNVNEAPTTIVLSKTSVPENSPEGTLVSDLTSVDPDNTGSIQIEQQLFTFELLDDAQGRFLVKNNNLYVKTSTQFCGQSTCQIDFESKNSLNIVLKVTDNGNPPLSLTVSQSITIIDVNDVPYNLHISTSQIRENKPEGAIIGTLSASDQDKDTILTYSLLNYTQMFNIDGHDNLIQLLSLDYESQRDYFISVQVTDNGSPVMTMTSSIKIEVLNINEAPMFLGPSVLKVSENGVMGTAMETLTVQDPDIGDTIEITLKNFKDIFIVGNKEVLVGKEPGTTVGASLVTAVILDYESQSEYNVLLSLVDKQGVETVASVNIQVLDENDPPQDILINNIATSTLSVQENAVTSLAVLTAVDEDVSQISSFSVISQPGDNFVIVGSELKVSKGLDYETSRNVSITLQVIDSGSPSHRYQKTVTINVVDVNEPPTDLKLSNNKVEENSLDGTVIGTFQVTDPDNEEGFTFSLLDSANGKFRIEADKLLVVSPVECSTSKQKMCSLNFELRNSYTLKVIVTDSGSPRESASFNQKIEITDANDAPDNIVLSDNKVDLSAKSGIVVGDLSASDEDSQQTLSFSLKDDAGGMFKLLNSQLIKSTDAPFLMNQTYSVIIVAQDSGIPIKTAEQTFYINVVGGNDAPRNLTAAANSISRLVDSETIGVNENLALNSSIASITAEDINLDQTISFTFLVNENSQFLLDKNSSCNIGVRFVLCSTNIYLAKAANFEKQDKYSIIIVATDSNNQQTSKSIAVQIFDVGEAPTDIVFSAPSISVPENSENLALGVFSALDEDKIDSHIFSLKNSDGILVISANGELSIAAGAKIDYEAKSYFNISVVVTDSNKNLFEKVFTVNVLNLNEPPLSVKLSNNTILEGSPANTIIGELLTDDPDNKNLISNSTMKQTFEYLLLDDAGGRFQLSHSTLKLTTKGAQCSPVWCGLDFETQKTHQLQVQVVDSGSPRLTANLAFFVQVLDANDPPVFAGASIQLKENMKVGNVVTKLSAIDPDAGQTLTYTLDSDIGAFKVAGNQLMLASPLDYESTPSIVLQVTVLDSGVPPLTASATFNFEILNVGEAPSAITMVSLNTAQSPVFSVDQPIIGEATKPATAIGQFTVLDPDYDEDMTLTVTSDVIKAEKPSCFTVTKQGSRCVSTVALNRALDFEAQSSYTVGVSVIDKYGLKLDKIFTLLVKDENDPPLNILINNEVTASIKIKENSQGSFVVYLGAIDPDKGQIFVYTVSATTQFYITDNMLKVSTAANIDYERTKTIQFTLKVTDSGQPPLSFEKNITVEILDVNEPPSSLALTRNKVSEDASVGTEVGSFVVTDPDNKEELRQAFTFELTVNPNNIFGVRNSSLVVSSAQLDFEMSQSYIIKVKVTDSGSPPLSGEFDLSLQVVNVNEPPTNLQLSAATVSESAAIDTVVGILSAQDADVGQAISFTVANSEFFTVTGNALTVFGRLDFETAPRLNVEVTATDTGTPPKSFAMNFTITVADANEPPLLMNFTSISANQTVAEKTELNGVIGYIETYDPDNIDRIGIELTDASAKNFRLDTAQAVCVSKIDATLRSTFTVCSQKVLLAQTVRYSADSPFLTLDAVAKDKGLLPVKNSWKITVLDSNDPPFNISIGATKLEIAENQKLFKLGLLTCDDPDIGQSHVFQVITYWDTFAVDSSSLLFTLKALDYEQQSSYQLTLRCIDGGVPPANFTKTFTIVVQDVNEQPNDIKLSNSDISAVAKDGETVAIILVFDPDNTGANARKQDHACVVSKDESGSFKVGKDGLTLQINGKVPVNKTSVKISLNCSDNGSPSLYYIKDFDVFISNTTDVPKAILLSGNKTAFENSVEVEVGKLSIINTLTETEITGGSFYYEVSNNFTITGNTLILTTSIDFESTSVLDVTVTAIGIDSNQNNVELSTTFKIQVQDVNEAPRQINIYGGGMVIENSAADTIIGDLNTVDPELYQTFTYSLISVAAGLDIDKSVPELLNTFQIAGRTLKVGINSSALDYETAPIFSLVIQTVDSGTPPLELIDTLRIIVMDANDPPTDISLNNSMIAENADVGTLVGVFTVADQDVNQSHSCVVNNLNTVPFTVDNGLALRLAKAELDYEGQKNYIIQVTCEDSGTDGSHLKVTKSLTINVTNVNEPPYDIQLTTTMINENNIVGQLLSEITATDPDSQQIFFTLLDESSSFEIQGNASLVATAVLDYETKSKYVINVKATDESGLWSSNTFNIQVVDVNEKPTSIKLTQNVISEAAPRGSVIASIVTEDPDRKQTFLYSLAEPPPSTDHFYIVGDQLLVGKTKLDFEYSTVYRMSITSTDSGSPAQSLTVDFDLQVTDANEPPTAIIPLTNPIIVMENASISTVLSEIQVTDQDRNQTHSCQTVDKNIPFVFITSTSGQIQLVVGNVLDFEEQALYQVNTSCSDGEFTIFEVISIAMRDINEAPTAISLLGPQFIPSTVIIPYPIGQLKAEDDDIGQTHTFSTEGANSELLKVQGPNQLVLVEPLPTDLLERPDPSITVEVLVADSGQPVLTFKQLITFIITEVDIEELRLPDITINNTVIPEGGVVGDPVGVLYDTNMTIASSVVFKIVNDASSLFAIKDNKFLILSKNISSFYGNSAQVTVQAKNSQTQEVKSRTITIVVLRSDKCYDNGRTCSENARCVQVNETWYQCRCNEDFDGDGYYCQQIDNCKVNVTKPCLQGKCKDGISSFQCFCDEGYTGVYCEVPPVNTDPCQKHQCKNNASCKATDDQQAYTCMCQPGWTGQRCETNIDDCSDAPCPSYQECVDGVTSFFCICPSDKVGQRCQFYKDACLASTCDETQLCVPMVQQDNFICSKQENIVSLKINCAAQNTTDLCTTHFLEFVQEHGRFNSKARQPSVTPAVRKKRAFIPDILSSVRRIVSGLFVGSSERPKRQTIEEVNQVTVYLVEIRTVDKDILELRFVAMDTDYIPFTVKETVEALGKTCISIVESGQSETSFCPFIMVAYNAYTTTRSSTITTTTSSIKASVNITGVTPPNSISLPNGVSRIDTLNCVFLLLALTLIHWFHLYG